MWASAAALRLEVEVQVDDGSCSSSRAVGERLQQPRERIGDLVREERAAAFVESRHEHLRLAPRDNDVRLERSVPVLHDLAAERDDVVVGGELRRSRHLECAGARGAAMRPVHRDRLAGRPPEELVHRDPERLRLEVEERVLDARQGLRDHGAGTLPSRSVEVPVDCLDGPRVPSHDERREVLDDSREAAGRAVRIGDLSPADEAVVGRRLEEDPRTPAGVAEERLERGDSHGRPA
jgi:hypothetical protein